MSGRAAKMWKITAACLIVAALLVIMNYAMGMFEVQPPTDRMVLDSMVAGTKIEIANPETTVIPDPAAVFTSVTTTATSPVQSKTEVKMESEPEVISAPEADSQERTQPEGRLEVRVLTPDTIVLIGDYTEFLRKVYREQSGGWLKKMFSRENPLNSQWARDRAVSQNVTELIAKYRPYLCSLYGTAESFEVRDRAGKILAVEKSGFWLNPNGQSRFETTDGLRQTQNADVLYFAFLKLNRALSGGEYTVSLKDGEKCVFAYHPGRHVSPIIKLNQLGYAPSAGKKYAYAGTWCGTMGPLPLKYLTGKLFALVDAKTGKEVFQGVVTYRGNLDGVGGNGEMFTGEETLEFDFSAFSQPGEYVLKVPDLGETEAFKLDESSVGDAFYMHTRGLYHQRCGTAKEKPWTNWEMGACHTEVRQGDFPPDNADYAAVKNGTSTDTRGGFFDENGKRVAVRQFDIIATYRKEERPVLKGVRGGWHDAADYDRRPFHFVAVNDLLAAYLFAPKKFADGQQNIPESGNGIPDILDEAVYGMEVWRRAQKKDGSTGTWIETWSHPYEYDPGKDKQKYYLSAGTRNSTLEYAAHASMLALAFRAAGLQEQSKLWLDSALKGWEFAKNEENRFTAVYTLPAKKKGENPRRLRYVETGKLNVLYYFKTLFNLYLLTDDPEYVKLILARKKEVGQAIADLSWKGTPLRLVEFQVHGKEVRELASLYKRYDSIIRRFANEKLVNLEQSHSYRTPWYRPGYGYVKNMGWGNVHPLVQARFFIAAWHLTGDQKYRDAALLCNDYHNGANPLGLTWTSGLGKCYPVRFLDLPSYPTYPREFLPGISPYRHIYGIPYEDVRLAHGLYAETGMMTKSKYFFLKSEMMPELKSEYDAMKLLRGVWPIWRRFANVEAHTVSTSEFTVWETIAPAAAVTGSLMPDGYQPSARMKEMKPAGDLTKLPGYMVLP